MRSEITQAVLDTARNHPGASRAVLAERSGLTADQVAHSLVRLAEEGLVVRSQSGLRVPVEHAADEQRSRPGLTPVQRREDIVQWLENSSVSPSQRAMSRCYEVALPVIQTDIRMMRTAGVVDHDPDRARGHDLMLTGRGWADPTEDLPASQRSHPERRSARRGITQDERREDLRISLRSMALRYGVDVAVIADDLAALVEDGSLLADEEDEADDRFGTR